MPFERVGIRGGTRNSSDRPRSAHLCLVESDDAITAKQLLCGRRVVRGERFADGLRYLNGVVKEVVEARSDLVLARVGVELQTGARPFDRGAHLLHVAISAGPRLCISSYDVVGMDSYDQKVE